MRIGPLSPPWPSGAASRVLLEVASVLSPITCAGCGAHDVALCSPCRGRLEPRLARLDLPDGLVVFSGLVYEFEVRQVVLAFKNGARTRLAPVLARALALALDAAAGSCTDVLVVAVPSSRRGRRRRGYDPLDLVLRRLGPPLGRPVLVFTASTRGGQKGRDRLQRQRDRVGSMRCTRDLTGAVVVVVDDVVTTGGTLQEARRALEARGARVVAAACVAATPLRGRQGS